ncbi:MAG: DNA endonuclease SmrA [Candidatus Anaerobiospirillum merdipullorum]|uniref:DNA endonuclease SmrA n=1 Tax=Candidatus Anaerobiospirillum merdipullorum TaxID=2838450 RepID=A0A9E2KNW0_9GAMM|nr:DNA endonuclease SmrA [Candidatus Anaerobiospirillum merdipullorum]
MTDAKTKLDDFAALLQAEAAAAAEKKDLSFSQAMADIKPVKQDKVATRTELMNKDLAKLRQEAAVLDKKEAELEASSAFVPQVDPNEVLVFRREGVQPYVLRRLKNGEYLEADYIDLHGNTVEQAYNLVMRFLEHAKREEFRCVLIIHGKGSKGPRKALLKSYVAHWLRQIPEVLAFHSAPEWKGGTGSVYVILKKGDKSRAENREQHAKRQIATSANWR